MRYPSLIMLLALLVFAVPAMAAPPVPETKSKCAVCGMFVQRHLDWLAVLELEGAAPQFFCGPKDLFKFLHFPQRYRPEIARNSVLAIHLKDYYTLEVIDGRQAFFVTGSDIRGPMGKDLIPFGRREDAAGFLQDHDGRRLLPFADITPALLQEQE
jgi:nitrous oxide reductase accessory protein NosL